MHSLIRTFCGIAAVSAVFWPDTATATEPLETFLQGAREQGFSAREQQATVNQRNWEAQAALGRLLPSFEARGTMTHNQYGAELPPGTFPGQVDPLTITAQNQLEATFNLHIPLIDLSQYARYSQSRHVAKAAQAQQDQVYIELDGAVTQAYYTYVGASALVAAADGSLGLAQENFDFVSARADLGAATDLDRERARANVERSKRDVSDAKLIKINAARNLETLSGLYPSPVTSYPIDDLRKEAPLEEWLSASDTPTDRIQKELTAAAKAAKRASAYALLPTLSANATERISNAAGFTGQASAYALQGVLRWSIDYNTYSTAQAMAAAADVQKVQAEQARRGVQDSIYDAYYRVEANIAKSTSARAESAAAKKAAALSMERYQAGALTQLDVTQSQREAFQAQSARIKADADLALSRVLLRVSAGKPADVPPSTSENVELTIEETTAAPNSPDTLVEPVGATPDPVQPEGDDE